MKADSYPAHSATANARMTEEQLKAAQQIQKLLNLAAKAGTPEEAASAAAKAQELLTKHNLDSAAVAGADGGKREKNQVDGGTYQFQRDLWKAVAELNFCIHWNQKYRTPFDVSCNVYVHGEYRGQEMRPVMRRRHALVGRTVNVRTTVAMAEYLQGAVERVLTDRLAAGDQQRHSNWAWSFRKGAAWAVIEKLMDRRREYELREAKEIKKRMAEAAAQGADASSGTALTVAAFKQQEEDANLDFMVGEEGYAVRRRAEREHNARMAQAAEDDYTRWAAANPKEAASKWSFTDEDGRLWTSGRPTRGTGNDRTENIDYSAYKAGRQAGAAIGIDPQAEGTKERRKITGPKALHL